MFRSIGAAALALAATSPVLAQGKGADGNPGQGRDKDRAEKAIHGAMGDAKSDGGDKNGKRHDAGASRAMEQARRASPDRTPSETRGSRGDGRQAIERTVYRNGRDGGWDGGNRWADRERLYAAVPACPPGLARKNNGCLPPGLAKKARDDAFGFAYRPALFGVPLRVVADYVYHDGYLIPSGGGGRYVPLLGGALAIGQLWPEAYPSLPLNDWQRDYYGFDDPDAYRYADNVLYRVDPATSAIEAVVALLSGSDFTVGQPLPGGYDVYNVPTAYQDRYADSGEVLYRYDDGRVYEVDPVSMLIEKVIDLVV